MRNIQIVLLVLAGSLLGSCCTYTDVLTYEKMSQIQPGMSSAEVIEALGDPFSRSFNDEGEVLEFRERLYEKYKVVRVSFVNDKVVKMDSFIDKDYGFPKLQNSSSEQKKEDSSDKDTSSIIRVSSDGGHCVQMGSLLIMPDGKHESIVADHGTVVVTASGEHIHLH